MKKGVQERLATGVILIACIDLVILVSFVTGINFFKENFWLICIPSAVIAMVVAAKLSKNYDTKDNYDKLFYFLGILLLCLFTVGLII